MRSARPASAPEPRPARLKRGGRTAREDDPPARYRCTTRISGSGADVGFGSAAGLRACVSAAGVGRGLALFGRGDLGRVTRLVIDLDLAGLVGLGDVDLAEGGQARVDVVL